MAVSQTRPSRAVLAKLCQQNKSHRQIAEQFGVAASTAGWWLSQYKLKTVNKPSAHSFRKPKCKTCGTTNPRLFYYGRKSSCCQCWSKTQNELFANARRARRVTLKYAAVQAKGGCCQRCGYRKNLSALQFHHPNRALKHENWGSLFMLASHSFKHAVPLAKELEKCELLCANCHAEEHNPRTAMPMCMTGNMLTYLSRWVTEFRHLFHTE